MRDKVLFERPSVMTRVRWWIIESLVGNLLLGLGLGCVIVALAVTAVSFLQGVSCRSQGQMMGIEVSHSMTTGCMISINGQWLPWTEVVPVDKDGKIIFIPKPVVHIGK